MRRQEKEYKGGTHVHNAAGPDNIATALKSCVGGIPERGLEAPIALADNQHVGWVWARNGGVVFQIEGFETRDSRAFY